MLASMFNKRDHATLSAQASNSAGTFVTAPQSGSGTSLSGSQWQALAFAPGAVASHWLSQAQAALQQFQQQHAAAAAAPANSRQYQQANPQAAASTTTITIALPPTMHLQQQQQAAASSGSQPQSSLSWMTQQPNLGASGSLNQQQQQQQQQTISNTARQQQQQSQLTRQQQSSGISQAGVVAAGGGKQASGSASGSAPSTRLGVRQALGGNVQSRTNAGPRYAIAPEMIQTTANSTSAVTQSPTSASAAPHNLLPLAHYQGHYASNLMQHANQYGANQ